MDRLFLDANIFFAAVCSEHGGSRFLFRLQEKGCITLFSSTFDLEEARRNLELKQGQKALTLFLKLVSQLSFVDKLPSSSEEIKKYEGVLPFKDILIISAAQRHPIYALITLDKKDFFNKKVQNFNLPFSIMMPGDYIRGRIL